jgi:hypothetical protein
MQRAIPPGNRGGAVMNVIKFPYDVSWRVYSRRPRKSKNGAPDERAAEVAAVTARDELERQAIARLLADLSRWPMRSPWRRSARSWRTSHERPASIAQEARPSAVGDTRQEAKAVALIHNSSGAGGLFRCRRGPGSKSCHEGRKACATGKRLRQMPMLRRG